MRKFVYLAISLSFLSFSAPTVAFAQNLQTEIKIDQAKTGRKVNKLIFGQNLHPNFWGISPDNPKKLEKALKSVGTSILRIHFDELHWPDAIGPLENRTQVCWQHDFIKIAFGLDEFLNVADRVNAQVTLVINEDRASPLEIKDLLEYTNGLVPDKIQNWTDDDWRHGIENSNGYIPGTMPPGYFAWLRAQPGYGNRTRPWRIQYVEVGNEIFAPYCPRQNPSSLCHEIQGQCEKCDNQVENGCPRPPGIGRRYNTINISCENAGDINNRTGVYKYIDRLNEFINAIKSVDPDIKIGAVGLNGSPTCQWNSILINNPVAKKFDFIIDHPYLPASPPAKYGYSYDSAEYSQGIVSGAVETERRLLLPEWKKVLDPKNVKLANTEHSAAYTVDIDEGNDLRGALMTAGRFHTWLKDATVKMALYWHFGMSAMYHDWQNENPIPGPTALVYQLYADYLQDKLVELEIINNPDHQSRDLTYGLGAFQAKDIDALASLSDNGRTLSVFIINRNIQKTNTIVLDLGQFEYKQAALAVLKTKYPAGSAQALLANTDTDSEAVYIETKPLQAKEDQLTLVIKPHTVMVSKFSNCSNLDLNCDGDTSLFDLFHWRKLWSGRQTSADTNGDGQTNILDYLAVFRRWFSS